MSNTTEKSFAESLSPQLFGKDVSPYTPSRVVAGQTMGLRYPHIGEDGARELQESGIYSGGLKDAIIFGWLSTLPDKSGKMSSWTPSRAISQPESAVAAAIEWAAENKVTNLQSKAFEELWGLFMQVMGEVMRSEFDIDTPEEKEGEEGENSPLVV